MLMDRKLIMLLIILFSGIFVSAVTIGAIYDQGQLDGVDMNTYNFEKGYLNKEMNENETALKVTYGLKTLKKLYDVNGNKTGTYEVEGRTEIFEYLVKDYTDCLKDNNKEICLNNVKSIIEEKATEFVKQQRELLKSWQTKEDITNDLLGVVFE